MKPYDAMKASGFRASFANGTLKQDGQTQVSDAIQAMYVLYMTHFQAKIKFFSVLWEVGGLHVTSPPMFQQQLVMRTRSTFKRKPIDISHLSHPMKLFNTLYLSVFFLFQIQ